MEGQVLRIANRPSACRDGQLLRSQRPPNDAHNPCRCFGLDKASSP